MSIQSRQAIRLIKFVAELKKNNYPNAKQFKQLLRNADIDENIDCACSERTIMRDISILKDIYHAPIAFDARQKGFYLTDSAWQFDVPVITEDLLSMALIGTRLASGILPEPVRADMKNALAKTLTQNHSEFFDETMIESLLCATGVKAAVSPTIFKTIFDAWRTRHILSLSYKKPNKPQEAKLFEPHIVAFYHGVWYVKGYERRQKEPRSYAIQRIAAAKATCEIFKTDKKLVAETNTNGIFEYPKITDVELHADASVAFYFYEHQKAKGFTIHPQKDGSLIVQLKPAIEHELIRWVLGEGGRVQVLKPTSLRQKIHNAAQSILTAHITR